MRKILGFFMMSMLIIMFSGCGGGSGSSGAAGAGAAGVGAKGPFVQGSSVTAYKLNANGFRSTTDVNATVTTDDLGNYDLGNIPWSGATEIVISGNYFNENTGANSTNPISLSAVISLEIGTTISANINIFTDLEARRIKYLMSTGSSFADAQTQARADIVNLFDLNITADTGLEDLDLTDGSEHSQANAELLRVSAAVAIDPSVLDGLRHGIEDGNITDDSVGKGAFVRLGNIVDDDINMTTVSGNLETDLNVTDAPDANDTTTPAQWVDRSSGHAPVLDPIADVSVDEDSGLFTVTFHATDADGDSLSYSASTDWSILGGPGSGISGATLSLVPKLNKNGAATVTASVDDNTGLTATRTFTVTVNPVNDAPVANDDVSTIAEDTNVTINVLANDTDVDRDTLQVISVGSASHGSVAIDGNSSVKYTPNSNFNGTDTFTYQVADPSGAGSTATVTVTVTPVNDAPVAHDYSATLDEDSGSHVIDVLANDTDIDTGDTLTIFGVTQPTHGAVTIGNGSLNVSYIPNLNFNGKDTFTYQAKDSGGLMSTATVTVIVTPVNDAPVANDSTISAIKNAQSRGALSANDIDGDALTYRIVSQTDANGTVAITDIHTGAFTYDPANDFTGYASFTFSVNDGTLTSNTATVVIHVVDRVINVTANDDSKTIDEDNNITIDVMANDTSVFADDGSSASGTIISSIPTTPSNGTATIVSGKIKYVPNANYHGTDSFVYTITSASGSEDSATVAVTVNSVNDAPVLAGIKNINEDEDSADLGIALSAKDADNDTLTYSAISSDTNIVTVSVNGTTLTVHPIPNANGSVDVNVSVDDGNGGVDSTLFTVTLNPVNDNPVGTAPSYTTRSQSDTYSDSVSATDVDGDLNASGYVLVDSNLSGGQLTFNPDGNFTYDPNGAFDHLPYNIYGSDVSFRFTASDSHGGVSDPVTVSFRYVGLNDAPIVNEGLNDVAVYVGDTIDETVGSAFSDVDDNTILTYTATGLSGTGISLSNDGHFTGTVTANPGTYSVTITATDDHSASVSDTFIVTVNYPAQASDVNNTAWVLSDNTKVVFYPTGQFVAVGVDRNESFWDDGNWDINDTAHAVQLISSDGSIDFLSLPHAGPSVGDIVTDRFIDPMGPTDERTTLLITKVIDIQGTMGDLSSPSIVPDDVNSTSIRIADGPSINLFADNTYMMIDNADSNISRTYQNGSWAVVGGVLTLDNGDVNVTFAQSPAGEGTLGYHQDPNGDGLLTVRQVVDINENDPFTNPYAVTSADISRKAIIFTDSNAMHFYEANATSGGDYWFKGRDEDGVVKDKGTYQVESNGTVTLTSTMTAGDNSSLTFNSTPSSGTLIIATYPDGSNDALVIRKIFGFGAAVDYSNSASTGPGTFLNKSMQLTNGDTYSFYPDGIFKMHGLSYNGQTYYDKQGTWNGNSSDALILTYLDNSQAYFKFNETPLKKGTRTIWGTGGNNYSGIVKNVLDISVSHAIDAYPEYEYKVSDVSNNAQIYPLNGITYTVTAYSKDLLTSFGGSKKSINISFYGSDATFEIPTEYTSVVFKVYKGGEFVGSYGPFNPNSVPNSLGNHAFSE